MAVLLTTSYQAIASGTKSFTAAGVSCSVKTTIYARYTEIDPDTKQAIIQAKTIIVNTGNQFTSADNTQYIKLGEVQKEKSYDIGTFKKNAERQTFETTFTVKYDENGKYENVTLIGSSDVYASYFARCEGTLSLPPLETTNVHIGVEGAIKKADAYVGVAGVPTKCEVYVGKDGTPVKCA